MEPIESQPYSAAALPAPRVAPPESLLPACPADGDIAQAGGPRWNWRSALEVRRGLPWVIAHRGAVDHAPENTLASCHAAIASGADLVECDVRLSRDRIPVLMHDRRLARTTGARGRVRDYSAAELAELNAGHRSGSVCTKEQDGVPSLAAALRAVVPHAGMVVEIKERAMHAEVLSAVAHAGVDLADVVFFSFYRDVVQALNAAAPQSITAWLIEPPGSTERRWRKALDEASRSGLREVGVPVKTARPFQFKMAQDRGVSVFVWTANIQRDMDFLIDAGAAGIVTDRPAQLVARRGCRDKAEPPEPS